MVRLDKLAFKFVSGDGRAIFGTGSWPLPSGDKPGRWKRKFVVDDRHKLILCKRGYHMCRWDSLLAWAGFGRRLFLAEYRGKFYEDLTGIKFVVQQGRLLKELHPQIGEPDWPFNAIEYQMSSRLSRRRIIIKWLQEQGVDVESE